MLKWLYNFFFLDAKRNVSHTKFFSVLSSIIILTLFPYTVIMDKSANVELFLVIGAMFLANRTVNKIMEARSGVQPRGRKTNAE